jgi:hypothetical protein
LFVEPDKYIQSFFEAIRTQLDETKVGKDGTTARYRDAVVAATWANELWEVELRSEAGEPLKRQYDPNIARSSESAANYFVDALLRASGQEPVARPVVLTRFNRGRR